MQMFKSIYITQNEECDYLCLDLSVFICPSLGFYEFLDIKLLPQILSWQHKRGCYGSMRRPSPAFSDGVDLSPVTGQSDYDYDDNGQELEMRNGLNLSAVIGNLKIDHQIGHNLAGRNLLGYADISFIKGRQLLVEKEMRGLYLIPYSL